MLTYTQQFIPVVNAINYSLERLSGDILLLRVSQLVENPFDWNLIKYASVSLSNELKVRSIERLIYLPFFVKQRLRTRINTSIRLDTQARAAVAGFIYLYQNNPRKSVEAFSKVQHLSYGAEMHHLASCLLVALNAAQLNDLELVKTLSIPTSQLLRSATWPTVSRLRSVVDNAQIVYQSQSRSLHVP